MNIDSKQEQVAGIDQSDLPIFNQDWWINIARGSAHYRELRVFDGDTIIGKLPYILSRSLIGLFHARDPHWSHIGGPVVDERLSRKEQAEVLHLLLQQLPRWASIDFVCNPNASYADLVKNAFMNAGFKHTTQITYVRHPTDVDVMNTRKSKHNGHIKRACKELDCVDISGTEFVRFLETNLKARGKKSYSPLDVMRRLIDEAVSRGQARAIAAKPKHFGNGAGNDSLATYDAAIAYIWDSNCCYYWMSTHRISSLDGSIQKPHPDAIKLLAVQAMHHAQEMSLIFDADGVTTPGTENLYRNMFGLKGEERRDIFQRTTALERLRQKYKSQYIRSQGPSLLFMCEPLLAE
ncbi:hypothetical protein H7849_00455 [Alloacidobacterium dinghuense]|uniref:Uncharacterized protein n=1 Tax=Alloacidobacterium dinghuense TaxID=2763107 RepID=A0A7G8BJ20_9BACT|nr:hypothetical protein [Alloacidobacterium dinghuense]QNI32540.1 hypothetical protein H7849_00455 [Alloacidobacterium dinghuense]